MSEIALSDKTLKEAVKLGQNIGDAKSVLVLPGNGIPYAVIPNDSKVESLLNFVYNDYAERPHRKKATVAVLDAGSFIEYYSLFSDSHSRVFADETKAQVLAVLDYHGTGENAPRWGQHRVRLDLRHSEEWKAWTGHNGQSHKMSQLEFAEFIEDNAPDIKEPNAATMLEMARSLQAKTDVDFSSAVRTNNGQVQLKYTENIKGTYGSGNVEIPEEFLIQIPVYVGTERVPIRARLRYRLLSGKLSIWYDLLRADEIARVAFLNVLGAIKEGLKVTVINGTPGN
jgi:uncharacterized protein YfdQ (DUF2303 family)